MTKTILITGSSRGLGKSIASIFAKNNYNIVINYNYSKNDAYELKSELEDNYHVKVLVIKCDIKNENEVIEMTSEIKKKFGSIDVLVNNAGISIDNDYIDKSYSEFMDVIGTNLGGTYLVTKYITSIMDEGSIINIASDSIIDNYPDAMDYNASKAGIISLTHDFAKRLCPKIRVNAVSPGWINTDMNKDMSPVFKEEIINKNMLNRFAEPREIANVVYFLASEDASYINDEVIKVNGGIK